MTVPETASPPPANAVELEAENVRLHKVNRALMDRAERSASAPGSDFSVFQTTIMLEEQVRHRTAELQDALRDNERITRTLRESEAKFRGVVSQSLVGITMIEGEHFSYSNAKFNDIFGYDTEEIPAMGPLDFVAKSDQPHVVDLLDKRMRGELDHVDYVFRGLRKDGTVIDIECHGSAMDLDGRRVLISLVMDITERTRAEREVQALQDLLRDQATRDALTSLHNRRYLDESLERELLRAEREGLPVSVIMGDLDHFKAVNDRFGHLAGDEVLRVFADLMKRQARGSDICCRYGGEEFLLVLPGMSAANGAERAERLRCQTAAEPIDGGDSQIDVTASFGIATFPDDGRSGEELIAAADKALYKAKATGRNRVSISGKP